MYYGSKSYMLVKDITLGISFHRTLAKRKRRSRATKGRRLIREWIGRDQGQDKRRGKLISRQGCW